MISKILNINLGFKNSFNKLVADVRKKCGVTDSFNNAPAHSLQEVNSEDIVVYLFYFLIYF